jgi:hypothetical protein
MAKLQNELGRGCKPTIPPSLAPCPLALADRDRREALRDKQSGTAAFFGDPLPGMSALDQRRLIEHAGPLEITAPSLLIEGAA